MIEEQISSIQNKKIQKRVIFFIIEVVQNIEKYTADKNGTTDWFQLSKINEDILIQSQNKISNESVAKLKIHLETVTTSSKEEIDQLFFETLGKSIDVDKRSPGLGLIEMRRRNKKAFRYGFEKIDENSSYFNLELVVSENSTAIAPEIHEKLAGMRSFFHESSSTVFYAGEMERKILGPLIHLIENLKLCNDLTTTSKYQHCIIEKIQNAREHSRSVNGQKPGFFLVEQVQNQIVTACCNSCDDSARIISHVNTLNSLSEAALQAESKRAIMNLEESGGVGLIQIALYSRPSPILSKSISHRNMGDFCYISTTFMI